MVDFRDFLFYLGDSAESSAFTRLYKDKISDFFDNLICSALFLRIQPEHLKKLLLKTFDDNVSYYKGFQSSESSLL